MRPFPDFWMVWTHRLRNEMRWAGEEGMRLFPQNEAVCVIVPVVVPMTTGQVLGRSPHHNGTVFSVYYGQVKHPTDGCRVISNPFKS
jgi:hypothetical protein